MSRKNVIAAAAVLALVLLALVSGWGWSSPGNKSAVTSAEVSLGTVRQNVLATGMLEARQLISVGARVSGQIETLAVGLGDKVKAGDLIAQIDSQDQQNEVLQAEAALNNIEAQILAKQANLHKAELALARYAKLGRQNYSSQETVENSEADVAIYKADLAALAAQKASAEVTVSTAKIALDRTRITAPIDGTVVAVVVQQGQTVNALQSAPTIVKLAELDRMLVKVEISEADVIHVTPGQSAPFTILGEPGRSFDAVVQAIEPAPAAIEDSDTISSDEAIYYIGLLAVGNADGKLRIGMTAQVSVELGKAENVLTVPFSAVKNIASDPYVELVDPGTGALRKQSVAVGLTDKVTVEIRSGLRAGDRVATGAAADSKTSSSRNTMGPPPMF
jgi:macrolide-specific efflux system membrane fusion protein